MNDKAKFLIVWFVLLAAAGFFLSHFWSCTVFALQKVLASGVLPSLAVSKFLGGITGMHFLPRV